MTLRNILAILAIAALIGGCRADVPAVSQDRPANTSATRIAFDDNRAFSDLTAQCAFGPRVPGTAAHQKCAAYIEDQLKTVVDQVRTQDFTYQDPHKKISIPMTNIFGVINPAASRKIMLCAHWDTRPTADQDFDPANRSKPIPGADDGASGVAVLLELARALHNTHPSACVILAFWDGEDWGPGEDNMYIGARYFAIHPGALRPTESVLIDMIGQKDLTIPLERTSDDRFPDLCRKIWAIAAQMGYGANFPQRVDYQISDDHIPLIDAGIPSIDLIDFNYAPWHTLGDTPDKCSPTSLGIVGRVLGAYALSGS
ncbi:MAG: M28 family peptidase [Capsulimonadaceae bacterium]|nr:M28 family peptidase [Capsulimonadaceae bacterium]